MKYFRSHHSVVLFLSASILSAQTLYVPGGSAAVSNTTGSIGVIGGGSASVDFTVNGRIQSGDGANNGGVWLNSAQTAFVGMEGNGTLGFFTATAGWALSIPQNGHVGIGTSAPAQLLHVKGGNAWMVLERGSGNLALTTFANSGNVAKWGFGLVDSASDKLGIFNYATSTNAMTIDTSGNIGVGTTTPGSATNALGPLVDTSGAFVSTRGLNQNLPRFIFYDDKFNASYVSYDADAQTRFKSTNNWLWQTVPVGAGIYSTGSTTMSLDSSGNLAVAGNFQAAGRARSEFARSIGGSMGDTVAVGYFSNDGVGKNVRIYLKAHNGSVIDVHTYEINEVAYIGAATNWLELPLSQGSVSYTGAAGYAVDVYRSNISSTSDVLYVRVRVKRPIGAGTVQLVVDYDDDSTFTPLSSASSTATAFNPSTAPAGGAIDGYYSSAEWAFPVSNGQGWGNAGSAGLFVKNSGNVGIGTTSPAHKLAVNGTIRAKEVIVDTGWSDYVFADNYRLAPLSEVETHIKAERHLPGIPSAAEVAEHGVSMGEMQAKLLAKVEELTLHVIAQEKRTTALERENATLRIEIRARENITKTK